MRCEAGDQPVRQVGKCRGGGEIDLILRAPDGTVVFVEVRRRAGRSHGGAAASIGAVKRQRIVFAARHYLMRQRTLPPCRFDVVAVIVNDEGGVKAIRHIPNAFSLAPW